MQPSPSGYFVAEVRILSTSPKGYSRFLKNLLGIDFELCDYGAEKEYYSAQVNEVRIMVEQAALGIRESAAGGVPVTVDVTNFEEVVERAHRLGFEVLHRRLAPGLKSAVIRADLHTIAVQRQAEGWYFRLDSLRREQLRLKRQATPEGSASRRFWARASISRAARLMLTKARKKVLSLAIEPLRYSRDIVPLKSRDLSGFTHLVSSHEGLYAVNRTGFRKVASGQFFGISLFESSIVVFEALGPQASPVPRGRLVRFSLRDGKIDQASVVAKGLGNGCHQIDRIGDKLIVVDTYNQQLLEFDESFREVAKHRPFGTAPAWDWKSGYCHMNSVFARDGEVYVLKHNSTAHSGKKSVLARCGADFEVRDEVKIDGGMCHNIVFLEDGECLICDSMGGRVVNLAGEVVVDVGSAAFLRGLSVDETSIVVGESELAERKMRQISSTGKLYFFNRRGVLEETLSLPFSVMDIRKIDGKDFSLSSYDPLLTSRHFARLEEPALCMA